MQRYGVASWTRLRAYLKHRLHDYMTPSSDQIIESLPSTSDDELDRVAISSTNTLLFSGGEAIPDANRVRTKYHRYLASVEHRYSWYSRRFL